MSIKEDLKKFDNLKLQLTDCRKHRYCNDCKLFNACRKACSISNRIERKELVTLLKKEILTKEEFNEVKKYHYNDKIFIEFNGYSTLFVGYRIYTISMLYKENFGKQYNIYVK